MYEELEDRLEEGPLTEALCKEARYALRDMRAKLGEEQYYVDQLRAGLEVYLPGPFWEDVTDHTKASLDRGKHAEWVLRIATPGGT